MNVPGEAPARVAAKTPPAQALPALADKTPGAARRGLSPSATTASPRNPHPQREAEEGEATGKSAAAVSGTPRATAPPRSQCCSTHRANPGLAASGEARPACPGIDRRSCDEPKPPHHSPDAVSGRGARLRGRAGWLPPGDGGLVPCRRQRDGNTNDQLVVNLFHVKKSLPLNTLHDKIGLYDIRGSTLKITVWGCFNEQIRLSNERDTQPYKVVDDAVVITYPPIPAIATPCPSIIDGGVVGEPAGEGGAGDDAGMGRRAAWVTTPASQAWAAGVAR